MQHFANSSLLCRVDTASGQDSAVQNKVIYVSNAEHEVPELYIKVPVCDI